MVLREFLYRRDDLVNQFLAQLEGGVYDEEQITQQNQSGGGVAAGVAVGPVTASADRKKHGTTEASRTLRQTSESRFNRLMSLLEEQEAVQYLNALDDGIWEQLDRNEILAIDGQLTLAPGVVEMSKMSALGDALPLLDTLRTLPSALLPADFDAAEAEKMSSQLPLMQQLADHFANAAVPCTFSPIGDPLLR